MPELAPEITEHFQRMLIYHSRMDGNVPPGATIFIGDSLTQGLCVSAVTCPAVNYGIGSDTTVGVLQRLSTYQSIERAAVVVLAIGVNDFRRRGNEEIIGNFRQIVASMPGSAPIVISGVLPQDEAAQLEWSGRNSMRIKPLNQNLAQLAASDPRLLFFDAGPLLIDAEGNLRDEFHVSDGVHLNAQGNKIWIQALQRAVTQARQTSEAKMGTNHNVLH